MILKILASSIAIPLSKIFEKKARVKKIVCARICTKGLAPIMVHSYQPSVHYNIKSIRHINRYYIHHPDR